MIQNSELNSSHLKIEAIEIIKFNLIVENFFFFYFCCNEFHFRQICKKQIHLNL